MNGRDPHSALKSDVVAKTAHNNMEAVVARLQWGKEDVGYSLHVNPSSFTTAGIQTTDFLAYLKFQRSDSCSFTRSRQCYVKWVSEGFDPDEFLTAFEKAFAHLEQAESGLGACGNLLPPLRGGVSTTESPAVNPLEDQLCSRVMAILHGKPKA